MYVYRYSNVYMYTYMYMCEDIMHSRMCMCVHITF